MKKFLVFSVLSTIFTFYIFANLEDGLIAFYSLDGDALVQCGFGNHGELSGTIPVTDRYNNERKALGFDGIDDYIDIPYNPYIEPSSFSISLWIKNRITQDSALINSNIPDTDSCINGYNLWIQRDGRVQFSIDPGDTCRDEISILSDGAVNDDRWHQIIILYDSELKMYIDSVPQYDIKRSEYYKTNTSIRMGMCRTAPGVPQMLYNGALDDIAFYNRPVTQEEIKELYKSSPAALYGDVDTNHSVDIIDALLVAQAYVGLPVSNYNPYISDVTGDGNSDIVDALIIAQYYVGLIPIMPIAKLIPMKRIPYVSHHTMSSSTYQEKFDTYVDNGYRLTWVNSYTIDGESRFAAIWEKMSGYAWRAHHNMSFDSYQDTYDELSALGYRIRVVSGNGAGAQVQYAGLWQKITGLSVHSHHKMTTADFVDKVDYYLADGYRLTHINGFSEGDTAYFAGIWEKHDNSTLTNVNMTSSEYQTTFDERKALGYRLVCVDGYTIGGEARFAGVWHLASGPRWQARHNQSNDNYQAEFDNNHYQGYGLKKISGYQDNSGTKYAGIWHSFGAMPLSDLTAIDTFVQTFMIDNNIPRLTIALSKDERLVYAKGFRELTTTGSTKTSCKNLFRIASISKAITGTSIIKLLEDGELSLTDQVFHTGGILGNDYGGPVLNSDVDQIQIQHLLEHTSGSWGRDLCTAPTTYFTKNADFKDRYQLIQYVLANTGPEASCEWHVANTGNTYDYSNFGFCVLGRVIEKITGQTYENWVKDNILSPAGISNMHISLADGPLPREVDYDYPDPYGYDYSQTDSHGGWIASSIDLVRFLVRVDDLPLKPDILTPASIQTMITPSTVGGINHDYAKGWVVPSNGVWWHNGEVRGARSSAGREDSGFSWAVLINTNIDGAPGDILRTFANDVITLTTNWPEYDLF